MNDIKKQLYKHGLISVVRGDFNFDEIIKIAGALLEGGVTCTEVTLNTSNALEGIAEIKKQFADDLFVGAGTVRTAEDVIKAVDAGASYLIAPCLDLAAIEEAKKQDVLLVPGIFTASEAQQAFLAGCSTVKLFPADALGPKYLKALRAPMNHIDFIPTGGVNEHTIADFHNAGAVAFGVGSALVKNIDINTDESKALTGRATALVQALKTARNS